MNGLILRNVRNLDSKCPAIGTIVEEKSSGGQVALKITSYKLQLQV